MPNDHDTISTNAEEENEKWQALSCAEKGFLVIFILVFNLGMFLAMENWPNAATSFHNIKAKNLLQTLTNHFQVIIINVRNDKQFRVCITFFFFFFSKMWLLIVPECLTIVNFVYVYADTA